MQKESVRKKEPDAVRRKLLSAVGSIVAERGLAGVSLDAVARLAGVSKGGLLHHFPTRQALVDAFFASIVRLAESHISACLAEDTGESGRFTRAYLSVVAAIGGDGPDDTIMTSTALAVSSQPALASMWVAKVREGLRESGEDENSITGKIIRYATDGLWLEACSGMVPADDPVRLAVIKKLMEMTRTI